MPQHARAFDHLAKNRLFEGIAPDLLQEIAGGVNIIRMAPDQVIFREGDAGNALYLVGEGSVKISKSGRGGQQETLGFIEQGNFFGEMALLDGQPRSAMATANGPTLLGAVDDATFQHILESARARFRRWDWSAGRTSRITARMLTVCLAARRLLPRRSRLRRR